jgi:hypothetical protein
VIEGQFIVTLYDWLPVHPLVSVAVTVNVYVPDAVGVPDSTPVDEFNERPVGSVPDVLL